MEKCLQLYKSPHSPTTAFIHPPSFGKGIIFSGEWPCRFSERSFHPSQQRKGDILRSNSWSPGMEPRRLKLQRSCSANNDNLYNEEFEKRFQELERRFPAEDGSGIAISESSRRVGLAEINRSFKFESLEPAKPPWAADVDEDALLLPATIEMKANGVDLPFSLRMLKKKRQRLGRLQAAGDSACCSVKKAFSSLVFIVGELQIYTLQMRENFFCNNLEMILERVRGEMQAAFVCLFQNIFSHTPALMLSVMILLANFTVQSMSDAAAITVSAAAPGALGEIMSAEDSQEEMTFDVLSVKSFSVYDKPAPIGGNGGGGGKAARLGPGPMDGGEADSEQMVVTTWDRYQRVLPEDSTIDLESKEEEMLWKSVLEEASRMRSELDNGALDHMTVRMLVSPVTAEIEADDYEIYSMTELLYRRAILEDPDNALVLCNYAQFLYLVSRNLDWAEEFFKRAIRIEPTDADSLLRYAAFLWLARKDLEAAEETYLRAVEADPNNSFFASSYANFLWTTGAADTCFLS